MAGEQDVIQLPFKITDFNEDMLVALNRNFKEIERHLSLLQMQVKLAAGGGVSDLKDSAKVWDRAGNISEDGTFLTEKLEGVIQELQIADAAISELKLKDLAVNSAKLAENAVLTEKIADGAVDTDKIAANAVVADKINANAITSEKIYTGAVTAEKIGAEAVTTEKIQAGAVTADKVNVNELSAISSNIGHIVSGTIDASVIRVGADTHFDEGYDPKGKRRVFTTQPNPPYDVGDLWAGGSSSDLKRCIIAKQVATPLNNLLGDHGLIQANMTSGWHGAIWVDTHNTSELIDNSYGLDCSCSDWDWPNYPRWNYIRIPSTANHKYLLLTKAVSAPDYMYNLEISHCNVNTGEVIKSLYKSKLSHWTTMMMTAVSDGNDLLFRLGAGYPYDNHKGFFKDLVLIDLTAVGDENLTDAQLEIKYGGYVWGYSSDPSIGYDPADWEIATKYTDDTAVIEHSYQESPHNLPSYCKMQSDGFKVFDGSGGAMRAMLGGWLKSSVAHYGMKAISSDGTTTILDDRGTLQTWQIVFADNCDENNPITIWFYVPASVNFSEGIIISASLNRELFRSYSKGIASGGGAYVSTGSGGGKWYTSENGGYVTGHPASWSWDYSGYVPGDWMNTQGSHDHGGTTHDGPGHEHTIWAHGAHAHGMYLGHTHYGGSHRHELFVENHTHTVNINPHTHGNIVGIFTYQDWATSWKIMVDNTDRTQTLFGSPTFDPGPVNNVDIGQFISAAGWHSVKLTPEHAARLTCNMFFQMFMHT